MKMPLAAMHESAYGTKRTYRGFPLFVRFRSKADIDDRAALTASVVDDPKRTKAGLKSRSAAGSCVLSLVAPGEGLAPTSFQNDSGLTQGLADRSAAG